ncbi:Sushi, von Willebrand factor type A, EGF and pentraxin domain-containing protein 1 [Gryllus bimaculatus]|nr:Sushi, von Willebrand factor type A, EGF and pentraxin domain-containing protein 1 [Gryllus bimaculatus]
MGSQSAILSSRVNAENEYLFVTDIYQEFTIFVIQLLSKSEALYKPCYTFKGRFQMPRILFSCHDGQGHQGRYIYIRDDRRDQDYFALCEVEVFAHRDVIQTSTTCLNSGTWEKINISCIPDGDRNLPVKLTGKEWNEETGDDHEPDDFFIGMTGLISIGIFCSLLIISLITLAVFLAKRFQSKKNVEATLQSSTNDLIIGNTKDNMYDNGTGSAPSNTTSITTSTTATVTTAPPQVLSATIDKVSVPATTMLPLFTQGQEHSKYDTLQSFPSVSSYNSTVATDIEDEHHFNRMKRIEQGIVSERMRRPPNSVYDTMRLHAAPDHAQVDPEYETVRSLQQLAAESSYDLIHPNGLVGTLNKPKGKQGRSIPSALKMFLQPSSKPTESELCDGTVPAEVLALYAQVDKSKKRKYRADMPTRLEGQMHGSHVSSQTDVCECTNYPISDIARISQESYNPPLWNGNSKDCSDTLRESNVSNGRPLPSVPSIRFIQSSSPSSDMKTQTIECDQL